MTRNIKIKISVARKEHECMASEAINESGYVGWLTYAERRVCVRLRRQKGKILKGHTYERHTNIFDREIYDFVCDPEAGKIYVKYELWDR